MSGMNVRNGQKCRIRQLEPRQSCKFAYPYLSYNFVMNKSFYLVFTFLLSVLSGVFTLQAQLPHLVFHAELGGEEQLPPIVTAGKALITLIYTPDRTQATVSGMMVRLQGDVTSVKIRQGKRGEIGPVLLDLTPLVNKRRVLGDIAVPASLLPHFLFNNAYAEITTTAYPDGEIRGQFVCETDLDFGVHMTGDQVVPPTNPTAIAFGGIHFPLGSRDLVYAFTVRGLSSAITEVGIYEGSPTQTGTLVTKLPGMAAGLIQGLVLLDTIPPDFFIKALDGKYQVIIKTQNYPDGEVSGKVVFLGHFCSLAPISGVQQVPPIPTNAFGFNHSVLNKTLDSLTTTVFVNNTLPLSVKLHIGAPGQNGPAIEEFGPTTFPGLYKKTIPLDESRLTAFAEGCLYVNVTTMANPNGEIRGVLRNSLRKAYAYDLCGLQVVPPSQSKALGVAVTSVDQANCYMNYKIITDGLSGLPTDDYIAQANFGQNGNALYALENTAPMIAGSHEIMAALGPIIEAGGTYVQIGTPNYPNGEIRGQIRRGITCPDLVNTVDIASDVLGVATSPVPFCDYVNVRLELGKPMEGRLVMRDIWGTVALSQPVQLAEGEQSIRLQTGILPTGLYTLTLEATGGGNTVLLKKLMRVE